MAGAKNSCSSQGARRAVPAPGTAGAREEPEESPSPSCESGQSYSHRTKRPPLPPTPTPGDPYPRSAVSCCGTPRGWPASYPANPLRWWRSGWWLAWRWPRAVGAGSPRPAGPAEERCRSTRCRSTRCRSLASRRRFPGRERAGRAPSCLSVPGRRPPPSAAGLPALERHGASHSAPPKKFPRSVHAERRDTFIVSPAPPAATAAARWHRAAPAPTRARPGDSSCRAAAAAPQRPPAVPFVPAAPRSFIALGSPIHAHPAPHSFIRPRRPFRVGCFIQRRGEGSMGSLFVLYSTWAFFSSRG